MMAEDAEGVGHLLEPLVVVRDGQICLDEVAERNWVLRQGVGLPVAGKL